jgi:hypothetical protein
LAIFTNAFLVSFSGHLWHISRTSGLNGPYTYSLHASDQCLLHRPLVGSVPVSG